MIQDTVVITLAYLALGTVMVSIGYIIGKRKTHNPPARTRLPYRRRARTFKFEHSGFRWHATVNDDGPLCEIFLSTAKTGELLESLAQNLAVASSLALQYGCPLKTLRDALSRDTGGEPLSPLAMALDIAAQETGE